MVLFELVVALLFAGALFALWAERLGVPYPALLALIGALIALVPGAPGINLDPELALALFVAPTLLDAAYDASPRDLRTYLPSVISLAVVMVVLTIMAVAWSAQLIIPGMSLAAAVALGAIVAPPDASAATAVLRSLRPPHRLLVILEGESLFNDATSLLIYRVAVATAMTGVFSGWAVVPELLLASGGGVIAGWVLARLNIWFTSRVRNIPINVLLQFVATFALWMIADRVGFSAIITVVSYAMTIAQRMAGRRGARHRIAIYAVWDVAVLVLNVLAFVLIGLQLRAVVSRVHGEEWRTYALLAGAVCLAVILVRVAWIMTYVLGVLWKRRHFERRMTSTSTPPSLKGGILSSWCGMRGIVTLAAALALPGGASPFPYRDLIVFSAFCVVLSTLVLQGLTLRPLMAWLGLHDEGMVEREVGIARRETARAAFRALEQQSATSQSARILRREYQVRLRAEQAVGAPGPAALEGSSFAALQRHAVEAQRRALRDLRSRRVIGDDAFHVVEEEIDLLELTAEVRVGPASEENLA